MKAVRRGRAVRSKLPDGVSAYVNGMFKSDEGEILAYISHSRMRAVQDQIKTDMHEVFAAGLAEMFGNERDGAMAVAEEFQAFNDDLIEQTPWHEAGPTDPPMHAAEVWKNEFKESERGYTLVIYNPKPYMPFLEAGWSPQAEAGWIAAAWTLFIIRVEGRVRGG